VLPYPRRQPELGWLKAQNRLLATSRPYGLSPEQVRQLARVGLAEAPVDPLPDELQDLLAALPLYPCGEERAACERSFAGSGQPE
jgi:hypothetical protein